MKNVFSNRPKQSGPNEGKFYFNIVASVLLPLQGFSPRFLEKGHNPNPSGLTPLAKVKLVGSTFTIHSLRTEAVLLPKVSDVVKLTLHY